jgi:hypothetical protein
MRQRWTHAADPQTHATEVDACDEQGPVKTHVGMRLAVTKAGENPDTLVPLGPAGTGWPHTPPPPPPWLKREYKNATRAKIRPQEMRVNEVLRHNSKLNREDVTEELASKPDAGCSFSRVNGDSRTRLPGPSDRRF